MSEKGFDLTNVKCKGEILKSFYLDNGCNSNNWVPVEKGEIVNVYDNTEYWITDQETGEEIERGRMHYIKKKRGRKFLGIEDKYIKLLINQK